MRRFTFTFLFWLLLVQWAMATTVWVAATGGSATTNCANASGASDPGVYIRSMRTIWANCAIAGGDTINIKAGTYNEALLDVLSDNVPAGGSSYSNAITVQNYNNEMVTFTGDSRRCVQLNGAVTAHYYIFKGIHFSGCSVGGNGTPANLHHIKLDGINLTEPQSQCIDYYGSDLWVVNSVIHDCGESNVPAEEHAIYMEGPNALIENNEIYNVDWGHGIQFYTGTSDNVSNAIVRNNYFHNIGLNGDRGSACILFGDGDNIQIYNNICANSQEGFVAFRSPGNTLIANNTFDKIGFNGAPCTGDCYVIALNTAVNPTVRNNLIWRTTNITANISTTGATGTITNDHNVSSIDPHFVAQDSSPPNYALSSSTPATVIDAGATLGAPYNTDYAGNARGYNGAWDIGAFEYIGDAPPPPVSNQLVAALSFDEGKGTAALDSSGLVNHATLQSGATWNASGKYGSALSLDGTANSFAEIPYASSINLNPSGMTLEAWVKPSQSVSGFKAIIARNSTGPYYWLYAGSESYLCSSLAAVGGFNTTVDNNACDDTSLAVNQWTHIAITYDGTSVRYYRNGQQINSITSNENIPTDTSTLRIGASGYGEEFSGLIDEVRVYNYARTPTEITTDMNTSISGAPAGPGAPTVKLNPATSLKVSANNSVKIGVP